MPAIRYRDSITGQTVPVIGGSTGVTDHGALTGLADDDHPQYHNDVRGQARTIVSNAAALNASAWYRIATNGSVALGANDGTRAEATFRVYTMQSGLHQYAEFIAVTSFGSTFIEIVGSSTYSTSYPISSIRIIGATTYAGSAVEVQVGATALNAGAVTVEMLPNHYWSYGWTMQNFTAGSLPAGFTAKQLGTNAAGWAVWPKDAENADWISHEGVHVMDSATVMKDLNVAGAVSSGGFYPQGQAVGMHNQVANVSLYPYSGILYVTDYTWNGYAKVVAAAPVYGDDPAVVATKGWTEASATGRTNSGWVANNSLVTLGVGVDEATGITTDGWYLTLPKRGYYSATCKVNYTGGIANGVRAFIDIVTTNYGTVARNSWGPNEDGQSVSATFYEANGAVACFQVYQSSGTAMQVNVGYWTIKYLGRS